jgi:hypothetical protein
MRGSIPGDFEIQSKIKVKIRIKKLGGRKPL